ncbi:hypothetical protein [Thermincola ferriacetica]
MDFPDIKVPALVTQKNGAFCENHREFFKDKELYLLRNQSRGKGIGFFEAGNFYPDFILWILYNGKQYITFVDPKGIRNMSIVTLKSSFIKQSKKKKRSLATVALS